MYLLIGTIALLLGPVVYHGLGRWPPVRKVLDLAVTLIVTGLAIAILWDTAEHAGLSVLLLGVLGFVLPLLAEKFLVRREHGVHLLTLVVGTIGLVLHGAADGAALLTADAGFDPMLALGVIAHRVPAGLAVWWLVRVEFGFKAAAIVLGGMAVATIAGYEAAALTIDLVSNHQFAWFQAFVAGSLLHLAFHRLREDDHGHTH